MIRFIAVLVLIFLSSCGAQNVPVVAKFPDAPDHLLQIPPELDPLPSGKTIQMSDLLDNANANYSKYRDVVRHLREWQQWYVDQKAIWNNIN
jgi:hypothetical protein